MIENLCVGRLIDIEKYPESLVEKTFTCVSKCPTSKYLYHDRICLSECPNSLAYNKLLMICDVAKFDFIVHYPSSNNYITSLQDLKLIVEL